MRSLTSLFRLSLFLVTLQLTVGKVMIENATKTNNGTKTVEQNYVELTEQLEAYFKNTAKGITRNLLPSMLSVQEDSKVSQRCTQSLGKYIFGLNKAKMWAVQMLDATSKIPPGILVGTFADFGSFHECIDVKVFQKNGKLDFQGSSCALRIKPPIPPQKRGVSIAQSQTVSGEDTLSVMFQKRAPALHHKTLKLIVCVPSTCSAEEIEHIAEKALNRTDFGVKVPYCTIKETPALTGVQIGVLVAMAILFVLVVCGTIFESKRRNSGIKALSLKEKMLTSFSLPSNIKRLVAKSGGSADLKCIHGMRALGICYIILGHTYVYTDFDTVKDPVTIQMWFGKWNFEFINNAWLSVETFFLLSGILVTYGGLTGMTKTGGKLNVPLLILRRYLRLTPSVLLYMGIVFFLPLIGSGPFYNDHVGESVETCTKYWWTTILYFSNWWGVHKTCTNTTWYLAADFQLHILSLFLIILIYRYRKAGVVTLFLAIVFSCITVGVCTWIWDLGPTIQLSTGDNAQVLETVNKIHIQTFTHLGPHCIGMVVGYYIFQYKEKRLSKTIVILGWCASIVAGFTTLLGSFRFSAGIETSQILAIIYAAVHRSLYIASVAWVLLACIIGYGGPVNSLLSSDVWAPLSRLTYWVYLIHPLVIRVKLGSMTERFMTSHYEYIYGFLSHIFVSVAIAVPLYLLLEAPLMNIERLLTSPNKEEDNNLQKESEEKSDVTLITVKLHPTELQPNHLIMSEKSNS